MGNRSFKSIAHLIRAKRENHPKEFSQSELSHLLGYKNGQFISNVERGLCNIPLKMLGKFCEILQIDSQEMKQTMMVDFEITIENYLARQTKDNLEDGPTTSGDTA